MFKFGYIKNASLQTKNKTTMVIAGVRCTRRKDAHSVPLLVLTIPILDSLFFVARQKLGLLLPILQALLVLVLQRQVVTSFSLQIPPQQQKQQRLTSLINKQRCARRSRQDVETIEQRLIKSIKRSFPCSRIGSNSCNSDSAITTSITVTITAATTVSDDGDKEAMEWIPNAQHDSSAILFASQSDNDNDNDNDNDSNASTEEEDDDHRNDLYARSMFGTKAYWDDVYTGQGDFPSDTYSWYTNWNEIQRHVKPYLSSTATILIPGIGNDSLLIDMVRAGLQNQRQYNDNDSTLIVAQDYSMHAIERQIELLQSIGFTNYYCYHQGNNINNNEPERTCVDNTSPTRTMANSNKCVHLYCCDITRTIPTVWEKSFHLIIEKGLLDAVYLSDDTNTNIQRAIHNLHSALQANGILISISSVIPNAVRQSCFPTATCDEDVEDNNHDTAIAATTLSCNNDAKSKHSSPRWEWIRDGSVDTTKAGTFVFRKQS
jgi:hypothetical protein